MIYIAGSTPIASLNSKQTGKILLETDTRTPWSLSDNVVSVATLVSWARSVECNADHLVLWAETIGIDSDVLLQWLKNAGIANDLLVLWVKTFGTELSDRIKWNRVQDFSNDLKIKWNRVHWLNIVGELLWEKTGSLNIEQLTPWGVVEELNFALEVEWGRLESIQEQTEIPWAKTREIAVHNFTDWVPGSYTGPKKMFEKNFKLPWLSVARIIMTEQNVQFKRVSDNEPVAILSGSFGIDDDSYDYQFSAVIPGRENLKKVMPNALGAGTGEVEVELVLNGYPARFLINSFSENKNWGKGTYTITGRSPSCQLGAGYCVPETKIFEATTAEQIVAATLSEAGWSYQWGLITNIWNIDGEFSVVDKTRIEIVSEIAKAVGGVVQSDIFDRKIHLKKRHPIQPKDYAVAAVDEYLLSGILSLSGSWQGSMKYNKVVVQGKEAGCRLVVCRENTSGDIVAPEIIEPVLTAQALNIERGRAFLDANGYDVEIYNLEIPLPPAGSGQRPKMLFPCELIEVNDGGEIWRGRVKSAEIGFERAKTRQRISVERYFV